MSTPTRPWLWVVLLVGLQSVPATAATAASPGDTLVVSLVEAERRALERSPLLAPARAGLEVSQAQKKQARHSRYLPEFNVRNLWGPIPRQRGQFTETGVLISPDTALGLSDLRWFTQFDLNFVQPLYTFGKIASRIDAAEHQVEVSRADLAKTRDDVLLKVRQLYWGVVLGNELERVIRSVLDRVAEAEEKLQEQYDEGSATQNDMFKFRLFKYQIGRRAREVTAQAEKARSGLGAAIGLALGEPFRVETTALETVDVTLDSLSAYVRMALENRPELAQLRSGILARRSLVRASRGDARPTLFFAGTLSFNVAPSRFDPRNPYWNNRTNYFRPGVALGIDWDLNFLQHRDKARVERVQAEKLEASVEPLRTQVEQEVKAAYLDVLRARDDVAEGRDALKASQNWLRAELQTFDLGLGDIADVIDAFQANVTMEADHLQRIAAFNTALAELSRRVGRDIG